ncbi:DUF6194 family protein [Arthrobacter sp. 35W]|uniref:DUF6194 family protein n=1 Tax=Arthrobacter sp. 35W TaxID=1132441 RepID=UPI000553A3BC|nr:DUF6194 family protein [Arthrobacter sp. 35W]
MEEIIELAQGFEGVLVVAPGPGGNAPAIAWGDSFFYYAPDGQMPANVQPYATIVTKNYPDDTTSGLDPDGRWRLNIHVDPATFLQLTGDAPRTIHQMWNYAAADVVMPHPVYGPLGWIAVVNPADATIETVRGLLRTAHAAARARWERRHEKN